MTTHQIQWALLVLLCVHMKEIKNLNELFSYSLKLFQIEDDYFMMCIVIFDIECLAKSKVKVFFYNRLL